MFSTWSRSTVAPVWLIGTVAPFGQPALRVARGDRQVLEPDRALQPDVKRVSTGSGSTFLSSFRLSTAIGVPARSRVGAIPG